MNGYSRRMQQGGDPQQDQIMQLIQAFAQMHGLNPQEVISKLQQLPPEQQQQAIQEMAQVVQSGSQPTQDPAAQEAMMREGGWYYGGYMNHPLMEPNGSQHPVTLFARGGGLDRKLGVKMEDGGIHIDPRKKGTFKAQASKMGMSVQEAAAHILKNKDQYSPSLVKKANFARNFAKEFGGQLDEFDLRDLY